MVEMGVFLDIALCTLQVVKLPNCNVAKVQCSNVANLQRGLNVCGSQANTVLTHAFDE